MGSGIIFNNNPAGTFNPNGNNLTNTTLSVNTIFKDNVTFDNTSAILFDTGSVTQIKGSVLFNASSTLTFDASADVNFNTGSALTFNNNSNILFDTGSIVQSKVLFSFTGGGILMDNFTQMNFNTGSSFNMQVGVNTNLANVLRFTGATGTSGIHNIGGAVANPSYSFLSDNDTGMYNDTAGSISFACNGVRQLRVRSGGILTSSPLSGVAAQFFKVGGYAAGAPAATGFVNIEISGVVYQLLTST
jgi:hypothetical protein